MKNNKKKIAWILAIVLTLTLALPGCSEKQAEKAELKTVRIGGFTTDLSENAAAAKNLGYIDEELEKAGYKAEYIGFPLAGPALNEALASDQLDVGVYVEFPHLVLLDKGGDIRAFATANSNYAYALVAQKGINSVKELEGKKVVYGKGTIYERILQDIFEQEGADIGKVELVNAVSDLQTLFVTGEVDAAICILQAKALIEQQKESTVLYSTLDHPEFSTTINVIGRGKFLDENPEAAKAIVRSLFRSKKYIDENPEKAYEILATDTVSADVQKKVFNYPNAFDSFSPVIDDAAINRIESTNQWLAKQKIISKPVDVKGKYVDSQYIDAVKGEFE